MKRLIIKPKGIGDWWGCALSMLLLITCIDGLAFGTFGGPVGGAYIEIEGWDAVAASLVAGCLGVWSLSTCIGKPFRHRGAPRLLWTAIMGFLGVSYFLFLTQPRFRALIIAYALTTIMWLLSVWVSRSFTRGQPISTTSDGPPVARNHSGDD